MLRRSERPVPEAWLEDAREGPAWLLSARASTGVDVEAQFELGLEYLRGTILPENVRSAAHWLRQAADAGHTKACYLMAVLTREGEGSAPSVARFLCYLRQAAQQGLVLAQVELGKLYARGLIVGRDLVRSRELLRLAAASGEPGPMKELARMPTGLSTKQREADAQLWWGRAAAVGDAEALCEAAARCGDLATRRLELLTKGAAQRHPEALRQLGELQRRLPSAVHAGPRRDCTKAADSLAEACELWRSQTLRLREESQKRDARWLQVLAQFDEVLEDYLVGQRVLEAWHAVALRRRQLLQNCMTRYGISCKRTAWTRWRASAQGQRSGQHRAAMVPLSTAVLLQRLLTSWHLAVTLHADMGNLRVRLQSILRKAFLLWVRISVLKRRSARMLCKILKEVVTVRSRSAISLWHAEARRRTGIVRLVRWGHQHLLRRMCAPAIGTWQRWSAAAYSSVLESRQQEAEEKVAQLRKASEELMAYHRLELESWQQRCEDEQAFIETLRHERRELSSDREADLVPSSVCSRSMNVFNASDAENAKTLVMDCSAAAFQNPPKPQSLLPTCPELPALDASFYTSCASPPAVVEDTIAFGRRMSHTEVEEARAVSASSKATVQLLRDLRTDIAAEVQRSKDDRLVTDKDELEIKSVEARINDCIGRLGGRLQLDGSLAQPAAGDRSSIPSGLGSAPASVRSRQALQNDSGGSQSSQRKLAQESASQGLGSNAQICSGRAAHVCAPSQTSLQDESQGSLREACVLGAASTACAGQTQPQVFAESALFAHGPAHTQVEQEDLISVFKASSQLQARASRSSASHASLCHSTTILNDLSPSLGLSSSSTTPSTQGSSWSQTTPPSSDHRRDRRGLADSLGSNDSSITQLVFSRARANRLKLRGDLDDHSDSSSWSEGSEGSGSSYGSSPRKSHGSASKAPNIRVRSVDWTKPKPQSSVVVWPSTQRSRSYSTGRMSVGDSSAKRFGFCATVRATDAGAGLPIKRPPHSSYTVDTTPHCLLRNSQSTVLAKGAFATSGGLRSRDTRTRVGSVERQLRGPDRQPRSSKQTLWRS